MSASLRERLIDDAMRWADARQERQAARKALIAYRQEHGSCGGDEENSACYYTRGLPFDQWCDICKGAQPLWLEWRRACWAKGAALRSIACRVRAIRARAAELAP